MANEMIPEWFSTAIIEGIQRLVALSLKDRPAMETITLTAQVWVDVLWSAPIDWQQELDQPRLNQAFIRMMHAIDRWPAPKALHDYLPKRKAPLRLPEPPLTDEQKANNRARLAELLKQLKREVKHDA